MIAVDEKELASLKRMTLLHMDIHKNFHFYVVILN